MQSRYSSSNTCIIEVPEEVSGGNMTFDEIIVELKKDL